MLRASFFLLIFASFEILPARAQQACNNSFHDRVELKIVDGSSVTLNVARKLRQDKSGEWLELADDPGIELPSIPEGMKWVAKIPGPLFSRLRQRRAFLVDQAIRTRISEVEGSQEFPWHHEWVDHFTPSVPLMHVLDTFQGIVTLRPEVTGKTVDEIIAAHPKRIPYPIQDSLSHVYRFAQAVHATVRAPGWNLLDPLGIGSHQVSLDLSRDRLIWVDDPRQYRFIGLTQPGFVLLDLMETVGDHYVAPSMSEDDYLEEIFGAARIF